MGLTGQGRRGSRRVHRAAGAPVVRTNDAAFERAHQVFPGGVNSPVRAYGSVGGVPRFIEHAHGPYVVDITGREYVDLVGSWGPSLVGHAHPVVVAAVQKAAAQGLSFGAPTLAEVDLAEEIRRRVPIAQRIRLVSTGTEATMTAIRLARGVTGRHLVIKFAGCYHGHVDALLAEAGSGLATFALPGSAGVTPAVAAETIVLPYQDMAALTNVFAARGNEIAAVITEAVPANMGVIPSASPSPDSFNAALRQLTRAHGALFIVDEVLTGFRVGPAGWWGVECAEGGTWAPDLLTFGKVIGGGLPVAAVAGPAQIMDQLAPSGPVYQAGTLSGNPVAVAAGLATMQMATPEVYLHLDRVATVIAEAVAEALTAASVPHRIQRAGSLFSVFFGTGPAGYPVRDYAQAQTQDTAAYARFFQAMLAAGISLPPSAFEAWFCSAAHDDRAIDRIIAALPQAARAIGPVS